MAWARDLWLIYRAAEEQSTRAARREVASIAGRSNLQYMERATSVERSMAGRPFDILSVADAHHLYVRLHSARVLVAVASAAQVLRNPGGSLSERNLIRLEEFVRYKAHVEACDLAGNPGGVSDAVNRFSEWCEAADVEDEHDPRCLPFHVFAGEDEARQLATAQGRRAFQGAYGMGSMRTDGEARYWTQAKGRHGGQEPQQVAGHVLTHGFHWDVEPKRGVTKVMTTNAVWEVQPRGHVNVYPNSVVRGGRRGRCRQLWP